MFEEATSFLICIPFRYYMIASFKQKKGGGSFLGINSTLEINTKFEPMQALNRQPPVAEKGISLHHVSICLPWRLG